MNQVCSQFSCKASSNTVEICQHPQNPEVRALSVQSSKIVSVAKILFSPMQALYYIGSGIWEIYSGATQKRPDTSGQCSHVASSIFEKKESSKELKNRYLLLHGSYFLGSGVFELFSVLHKQHFFQIGPFFPVARFFGSAFFLLANVVMFLHYLERLLELHRIGDLIHPTEQAKVEATKSQCIVAIFSSLSYILMTATTLLGVPAGVIFFLFVFALAGSGINMLQSFFGVN